MKCGYGAILGVHNYVSRVHSGYILILLDFHQIRICYVFHTQNAQRVLCHHKSIVFVMSVCENHVAAAGLVCHCLQTPCENKKQMRPHVNVVYFVFPL